VSKPRLYWRDDETDRSGFSDNGELPDGPLVEEISALDFYKLNGICVCGKAEMDGIRCRFGAVHKTAAMIRDEEALS
jgi:hypothetical protein